MLVEVDIKSLVNYNDLEVTSMKKAFSLISVFLLLFTFVACGDNSINEDDWGSFTPEKTFSYDNKYYAVQTVEETEDVSNIIVSVYTTENDEFIASFSPARAMDFWGICWEKDSYNIWIQSSDIGIYCYKFDENSWVLDESLELPDYMKTRYD